MHFDIEVYVQSISIASIVSLIVWILLNANTCEDLARNSKQNMESVPSIFACGRQTYTLSSHYVQIRLIFQITCHCCKNAFGERHKLIRNAF